MTIEQVMKMPPPPAARDIFFINLPFVNIYARYHIDEALGRGAKLGVVRQDEPTYRTHVLTYAPDLLRMEAPCRLEQLDAYRFRVSIDADRPYFSGALGRFLIEGLRPSGRLNTGDRIAGELFDTAVIRADDQGVRELEFNFHQPLASERFCFYVGTPGCAAARVRFEGPQAQTRPARHQSAPPPSLEEVQLAVDRLKAADPAGAGVLFRAAEFGQGAVRRQARLAVAQVCQPVADDLAAPFTRRVVAGQAVWPDWEEADRWWSGHVDPDAMRVLPRAEEEFADLRWKRDALFRIRQIASTIIRADLYLTGPPFPGPRQ
jgi:hypothetical protein